MAHHIGHSPEGNGRAQRFFFDRLAVAAGCWWKGTQDTGPVNDAASRVAAEDQDLATLQEMLRPHRTSVGRAPDRTS